LLVIDDTLNSIGRLEAFMPAGEATELIGHGPVSLSCAAGLFR